MAFALVACGVMAFSLYDYGKPKTSKPATDSPRPTEIKHRGAELAPVQVYAKAQVGDWIAYRVRTRSSLLPAEVSGLVVGRVTAATEMNVTIEYNAIGEKNIDRTEAWSEKHPRQNLTLDELTDNSNEWTMFDVQITDDTHEIGGRAFKCKKLTYGRIDPLLPNKQVQVTAWYSDEVTLGLVQDRDVQDMPRFHSEQTKELLGFGTATTTTWGTMPERLRR
jgi:hypothetical protein